MRVSVSARESMCRTVSSQSRLHNTLTKMCSEVTTCSQNLSFVRLLMRLRCHSDLLDRCCDITQASLDSINRAAFSQMAPRGFLNLLWYSKNSLYNRLKSKLQISFSALAWTEIFECTGSERSMSTAAVTSVLHLCLRMMRSGTVLRAVHPRLAALKAQHTIKEKKIYFKPRDLSDFLLRLGPFLACHPRLSLSSCFLHSHCDQANTRQILNEKIPPNRRKMPTSQRGNIINIIQEVWITGLTVQLRFRSIQIQFVQFKTINCDASQCMAFSIVYISALLLFHHLHSPFIQKVLLIIRL